MLGRILSIINYSLKRSNTPTIMLAFPRATKAKAGGMLSLKFDGM